MKTIEITIQELQAATRPNVYRNRKKYTRKDKHRNKSIENWFVYFSIIKKEKKMYSLDFVGFKLEFNSLEELVKYCQMTFVDPYEYVTKDGKSIGVKVKEFYTKD